MVIGVRLAMQLIKWHTTAVDQNVAVQKEKRVQVNSPLTIMGYSKMHVTRERDLRIDGALGTLSID